MYRDARRLHKAAALCFLVLLVAAPFAGLLRDAPSAPVLKGGGEAGPHQGGRHPGGVGESLR